MGIEGLVDSGLDLAIHSLVATCTVAIHFQPDKQSITEYCLYYTLVASDQNTNSSTNHAT